jgi:hypothetical protein
MVRLRNICINTLHKGDDNNNDDDDDNNNIITIIINLTANGLSSWWQWLLYMYINMK